MESSDEYENEWVWQEPDYSVSDEEKSIKKQVQESTTMDHKNLIKQEIRIWLKDELKQEIQKGIQKEVEQLLKDINTLKEEKSRLGKNISVLKQDLKKIKEEINTQTKDLEELLAKFEEDILRFTKMEF